MRILCPILCVLVIFASTNAFVGAITKERLNKSYTVEYPITAENSESFTVEKNSYCTVYVRAFQFYGVYAEFTVADSKGEPVYEASGENCEESASLVLAPGEYTLSYKLAPGEKNELPSFEAVIITQVIETFEIAESQES